MTRVQVFEPPMCCSTGICGPIVDPALVRFSADLDWLKNQGVHIERYNLSQEPSAFVGDEDAKNTVETKGESGLPLIKVNGEVKCSGSYPSRDQLIAWTGLETTSIDSEANAEPVLLQDVVQVKPRLGGGCCGSSDPTPGKKSGCC